MTEDEVVQRMRERSLNPRRATSAGAGDGGWWRLWQSFPPAPPSVVRAAEETFGFPLPRLLKRLWSEVANGGVGPGYGIYGVTGGWTDDALCLPLPDLWLAYKDEPMWIELVGETAPISFPICDHGCCTFSAVDCSSPDGRMILFAEGTKRIDQGVTFARWIENWLEDIEF